MNEPAAILFQNVEFRYEKHQPTMIRNINLEIRQGDFVAIIGQNGAGKTTLAKHINGILLPTGGEVQICGKSTKKYKRTELAKQIGYCYQNPSHQIFSATVEKEIMYGPKALGLPTNVIEERVREALLLVGLENKKESHPSMLGRGERQRLAIASILATGASILVVDEPTTGLDLAGVRKIMNLLRKWNEELKVTIVLITHDIPIVAEYVPRTVVMASGTILKDAPTDSVLTDLPVLERAFVRPPQATRMSERLGLLNELNQAITVPQFVQAVKESIHAKHFATGREVI